MAYHEHEYPGQRVLHLPRLYEDVPGMQLQLDHFSRDDVKNAFKLVQEAAARGANVGIHEYQDVNSFRKRICLSESFALKENKSGQLKTLLLVCPFYMSRTIPVYLARIFIFSSADLDRVNAFPYLIKLSQQITTDLGRCYSACVMLVFRKCESLLRELRKQKFLVVACLPLGGELVNMGPCETLVLYREIYGVPPVELPLKDRKQLITKLLDPYAVNDIGSLGVPSLPVWHVLRDGTRVRLRTMKPDKCEAVYKMFLEAAATGHGYSVDETLSQQQFQQWFLLDHYNIVWEDAESGHFIAFSSIGDGPCARTNKATICDTNTIVCPDYRNRGIGSEIAEVTKSLAMGLGYSGLLSDSPVVSHRPCDMASKAGFCFVGFLPNCINMAGHGIVDLLCYYKSIRQLKPFTPCHVKASSSKL